MQFVASLAFSPFAHFLPLAQACEAAGLEAVSLSDHVVHPERIDTPYPYTADGAPRWQPGTPWPDPWVAAGAMAAVTERLRFVTCVYVLPMRNPFLVAKAVGTAAVLSGNRVALGVGAGWMKEEFELLGQDFHQRGRRMDEMLQVLRALWAGGMVEHHGRFYDFGPLDMSPAPAREIPIYAGGLSKPARRRAATRCDGWISDLHPTDELRTLVAEMHAWRADSERADRPFTVIASATDALDLDGFRRLEEAGVTHLHTMPWAYSGARLDDLPAKCDGIRRFGDEVVAKLAS